MRSVHIFLKIYHIYMLYINIDETLLVSNIVTCSFYESVQLKYMQILETCDLVLLVVRFIVHIHIERSSSCDQYEIM